GMAVAGLTPFGKIAKVGKGVKMTAKATEAVNKAKKVPVEKINGVKGTDKALLTNEGKVGTYKQLVKQGTAEIREGLREVIKRNKELYPHLFDK
ncbi:hypothetical protein P4T65_26260, partial [Bacillus paramycoides]|nr:hypothetical protein [Bacillus paramycoides]